MTDLPDSVDLLSLLWNKNNDYNSAFSFIHDLCEIFAARVIALTLLPYRILSYRSHGGPLPPSAEPHRPCDRGTSKPQNPDRRNPNTTRSATHSNRIAKATLASNLVGSVILSFILESSDLRVF